MGIWILVGCVARIRLGISHLSLATLVENELEHVVDTCTGLGTCFKVGGTTPTGKGFALCGKQRKKTTRVRK